MKIVIMYCYKDDHSKPMIVVSLSSIK